MTFGDDWGWGAGRSESAAIFEHFAEAGGTFIDTANVYTDGSSEKLLGEFVRADRDRFVLGSKYTLTTDGNDPNASGSHRKSLVRSLDTTLMRLGTDYLDVLWVHFWDPRTPLDELLRCLDDAVRSGKVLYLGISDAPAWVIARANAVAQLRGRTSFIAVQGEYSLLARSIEREHIPMARALDLSVLAWGGLASGVLTGKYLDNPSEPGRASAPGYSKVLVKTNREIVQCVCDVARELSIQPAQVALCWLRQRGREVIPIISATRLPQLEHNLASLDIELPAEALRRLDEVSTIDAGFPRSFVSALITDRIIFGKVHDVIESRTSWQ
jgi:aryl-alcohol dehydrogenase-like predicted oxidoreductase